MSAASWPRELLNTDYFGDYRASVVLLHSMREDDAKLPIADLMKKYPYAGSRTTALKSWE